MKTTALLTSLVLGVSSFGGVASASKSVPQPAYTQGMWFAITEPMRLLRGRDVINFDVPRAYGQLRIQATSGSSKLFAVNVMFTDGTHQSVALDVQLDAGNPMIQFAIDASKPIDRVIVTGTSTHGGSVQLFGM